MSYDWQPNVGDVVTVHFDTAPSIFNGTVRHYPQQQGEYWVIETEDALHFVNNYASICREKRRDGDGESRK